ncbi:PDZ domain-containing protein [candidate division KSB1 bacterium]|nr:PDZ domain-containing protein [candidate division KSB1 bacterium]
MKKKYLFMSLFILLSALILFSINNGIAGEKSSKNKGYLGVSIEELDRRDKKEFGADFGVLVSRIEIDSPADEYGLMEDDVIQTVNGVKIRQPHTLTRVIRKIKPGETARISVIRDGARKTLPVKIGKLKKSSHYSYSFSGPNKALFGFLGGGKVYLGVQLQELNEDLAPYFGVKPEAGALVMDVDEDSPACKAGFKSGDVITKIDGEEITEPDDVVEIISDFEEDDEVEISIVRKKRKQTIKVTLKERKGHGNLFLGPGENVKKLRWKSDNENKLIEMMDGNLFIDSPKSEIKIDKNKKKIKVIKGTI